MNLEIIEDFEVYLSNLNIQITPQALEVFKAAEAYCEIQFRVFQK